MNPQNTIAIGELKVSNALPFTLFGGMNVLESRELAMEIAAFIRRLQTSWGFPMYSRHRLIKPTVHLFPFRGPGMEKAAKFCGDQADLWVPVISDIHEPYQAKPAAEVNDVLQLPAFLSAGRLIWW